MKILPDDHSARVTSAVVQFWRGRRQSGASQGGTRPGVLAGKNMDGFLDVVLGIADHVGLPPESVFLSGRADLTLPGYFRPTKTWDLLVVHERRLLAILEFKSQVGSFGNNFNNRAEETLGNAHDLWEAVRRGTLAPGNHVDADPVQLVPDPRRPFLGYLMLLEDREDSTRPVSTSSRHFNVRAEFDACSYADRYRILCERLIEQGLYSSAALMLSPSGALGEKGEFRSLSDASSCRNLFAQLSAHLAASLEA